MHKLTFDDYCLIGMIDDKLREDITFYYKLFINRGYSTKDSIVRSLAMFTNTQEIVDNIIKHSQTST